MLFLFPFFSISTVFGVDFGSQFLKTMQADLMDTPEISMNYETKRITPAFIGFRATPEFDPFKKDKINETEGSLLFPTIGNKANEIMLLRPWLGTGFFSSFIGLNEQRSNELSKLLFVNQTAARLSFTELATLFFKLYIDCMSHSKKVESVTVVVPASYTLSQRREVETLISGTGYKFLSTLDDSTAISYVYGIEKINKFVSEPRTVLFIDVGASSVKAYCINFTLLTDQNNIKTVEAKRLSYVYSNNQGGAFVTRSLVDFIKTQLFIDKTTDAENKRLFDAAEKLKIQLTLLKSASTLIENIDNDEQYITIRRNELEDLLDPLIQTVINVSKQASNEIVFDDIEIIGGSSRIPYVQSSIQNAFGVENLGHSLNSDEALAAGAAYYAQFKAGKSKFRSVSISSQNSIYDITLSINHKNFTICEKEDHCVDNITIDSEDLDDSENIHFNLIYENVDSNLKSKSFGYKCKIKPNSSLLIKFSHFPTEVSSGRSCINKTICNYVFIDPDIPIFAASSAYHFIINRENQRKNLGKLRNDLEQLTLKVLEEIENNETIHNHTDAKQRFLIKNTTETIKQWISENADTTTDDAIFKAKLREIRDVIFPVYNRIETRKKLNQIINYMEFTITLARIHVLNWTIYKPYLNESDTSSFNQLLNKTEKWLLETKVRIRNKPLWENEKFNPDDFKERIKHINDEIVRISAIKPPPNEGFFKKMKRNTHTLYHRMKHSLNKLLHHSSFPELDNKAEL